MMLLCCAVNRRALLTHTVDVFRPRKPNSDVGKPRLVYRPEEHQHGLLPPPYHCGKYLRQRRVEFKLPYDLWWLHTHNQLPGRDRVPSWNYKKIRTSKYNLFRISF
jgi:histone-lysine N-methyltransferase ASH1L